MGGPLWGGSKTTFTYHTQFWPQLSTHQTNSQGKWPQVWKNICSHPKQKKGCADFVMGLIAQPQQVWQHSHLSLLTGDGDAAIFVVLNRRASLLDQCAIASGCEEGWNPSTPSPDPLCKSTLWGRRWQIKYPVCLKFNKPRILEWIWLVNVFSYAVSLFFLFVLKMNV